MRSLFSERLIAFVLILGCLIAFGRVAKCGFINFDDGLYVTQNVHVRSGLTLESAAWALTATHSANWHPLTWLSHMLDYEMFELNPAGHHLMNLFLHIANTLLLFLLLRNATGCLWESAAVAALFALHPLRVESVAWISERKDVLSAFWGLLAMLVYVQYARNRSLSKYALLWVLFALGLMAKPMLVTLPCVLLLLDFWPLQRYRFAQAEMLSSNGQLPSSPREPGVAIGPLMLEKVPLLVLSTASCVVTFIAQSKGGAVSSLEAMPLKVRVVNALVSYWHYLGKTFWPTDLAIFYPHQGAHLPLWQGITAGFFLVAVSLLVLYQASRRPFLVTGWFWFLGMLAPVIGIIQVGMQSFADRYTYLPSIGIFLMIAWTLGGMAAEHSRYKSLLASGSTAVLLCLATATWLQTGYWKETETVFQRAASVTKNNYLAHTIIGDTLAARNQLDLARREYETALTLWPQNSEAHNKLGLVLARQGSIDEAFSQYEEALRINPRNGSAHTNLATALAEKGELDEAAAHYEEALQIAPESGPAHNGLGIVKARLERLDEALQHFAKAIELCPECSEPHNNLGRALTLQGNLEEAVRQFESAIKLWPENAEAYNNLGLICLKVGALEEALYYFATAIHVKEDYAKARANLDATVLMIAQQNAPGQDEPKAEPW
jgi:protein O-mannosyl-transferase